MSLQSPPGRSQNNRIAWRCTGLLLLLVAAAWMACLQSPRVWQATGIGDTGLPFFDLYGLLASGEYAHAHGNAFEPNPLDPYHRPHFYTSWWLVVGQLGLTRADTRWVGLVLVGTTLVAAVAFLRPRTSRQFWQSVLVLCSPAMLMGVNRGNNDLEVFVLIVAALALLRGPRPVGHWLGAVLVAFAGVLKYYPLAASIAFLRTRRRRDFAIMLLFFAAVLVLAWPGLKPGLASAVRFKPRPDGLYAFGAPILFRDFGVESPVGWWLVTAAVCGWALWLNRARWAGLAGGGDEPDQPDEAEFICGAALITGSFFLGASYVYKLIFAVLLLPWLWREGLAPADERWRRATWWLLLGAMWLEGLLTVPINLVLSPWSHDVATAVLTITLVLGQAMTWGLVACLVQQVLPYVLRRGGILRSDAARGPVQPG